MSGLKLDSKDNILFLDSSATSPQKFLYKYSTSGNLVASYGVANAGYTAGDFDIDGSGTVIVVGSTQKAGMKGFVATLIVN